MINITKNSFPKFTREQNSSCKLSNKQIYSIPYFIDAGFYLKEIAARFNVSVSTIHRWTKTPKERKIYGHKAYLIAKSRHPEITKTKSIKSIKKHYLLHPEEMEKWKKLKNIKRKKLYKKYHKVLK